MSDRNFEQVVAGFAQILAGLGVPPSAHTEETARRAAKAWWTELCAGLTQEPPKITTFPSTSDQMVVLRDIPIKSICSHHLLPFVGTATIGYVPGRGQILGLSKLSRLANFYARRPQVQEELTNQIADALACLVMNGEEGGVAVMIRANHFCMSMRGVQHNGDMVTSSLRGVFMDKPEAREEFLELARQK